MKRIQRYKRKRIGSIIFEILPSKQRRFVPDLAQKKLSYGTFNQGESLKPPLHEENKSIFSQMSFRKKKKELKKRFATVEDVEKMADRIKKKRISHERSFEMIQCDFTRLLAIIYYDFFILVRTVGLIKEGDRKALRLCGEMADRLHNLPKYDVGSDYFRVELVEYSKFLEYLLGKEMIQSIDLRNMYREQLTKIKALLAEE